jgi:DNA-binding NarL/FixJ family response regulator
MMLASRPDFEVCAEAADGQEAVDKAKSLLPDLIILDITMPVLNGLEAARAILRSCPQVPILILSVHRNKQLLEEAQRIGVRGYVTKGEAIQHLIKAADTVIDNQTFFPDL